MATASPHQRHWGGIMGATVPKLRGRPWRRGSCSSTSRHFAPRSAGALSRNCDRQVAPKQSRRYPSASEAHACDPNVALTSRATQPVRACPGPAPTSKQGCAHPATDRRPPTAARRSTTDSDCNAMQMQMRAGNALERPCSCRSRRRVGTGGRRRRPGAPARACSAPLPAQCSAS